MLHGNNLRRGTPQDSAPSHRPLNSSRRLTTAVTLAALVALCCSASRLVAQQERQSPEVWPRPSGFENSNRPQPSDWETDNQDMVAASAQDITDVLKKDPGLMVELKRLLAKQATDRGQIVSEQDLQDPVIFDRLESDTQFRALATRLLQRYGYLTPQMNPKSFQAREQELMLRVRAQLLARGQSNSMQVARPSNANVCPPGQQDSQACLMYGGPGGNLSQAASQYGSESEWQQNQETGAPAGQPQYGPPCSAQDEDYDSGYDSGYDPGDVDCVPQTGAPRVAPPGSQPSPQEQGPNPLGPDNDQLLPNDGSLLTASATSSSQFPDGAGAAGLTPDEMPETGNLPNRSGQSLNSPYFQTPPGMGPGEYGRNGAGASGMNSPGMYSRPSAGTRYPYPSYPYQEMRPPAPPEPVRMVNTPSPYAYIPSLYDLYVQATPRTAHLERFGLEVFRHIPRNNRIPMDLPAGPDYVLGPGDRLTIDLWGGVSERLFRTVDREGRLSLPEAGPLQVTGRPLGEVQEVVQRVLRTQYRDVSADVALSGLRTVRVYVVGDVVSPGAYDVSSLSTPLNALWMAGGVTSRGSLRLLRHRRGDKVVEDVDVYDLLLKGVRGDLQNFQNGDTLFVPPVGPQVTVDGMVRRPAIYELAHETNLAQVIDLAGGMLPAAALSHIEVQRLEQHQKRTMLSINLDQNSDMESVRRQLADFAVQDGDEVHIFPIAPYNSATVYLQGHVLRPGRYAYTPGMTVANLFSSYKDLMPEPAEHYAEIIRLEAPDWRPVVETFDLAAALAKPADAPKLAPLDTVRIFGRYDVAPPPVVWLYGEVRTPGEYRTTGQMHLRDAIYEAGGLKPDAALGTVQLFRTEPNGEFKVLNVNLAAALNADPMDNVLVEPRDRILVHRSLNRVDPPSVYVRGEVANPGRYPLAGNMRISDLLGAAGGVKRSADLPDGDLTRFQTASSTTIKGEHQRVDLTIAALDSGHNLLLKDGDVLSVPQLPGWNDLGASVTLKGEVKNPGVYGISPGERLSSVISRAGGLLPTAYPQGAIFTRASVRELQQKSRDDLIERLEQESPDVKASVSTSGTEEAALEAAALQQRDRAIEALRQAPVSGRMVVRMPMRLKDFAGSSQDVELMNGDTLNIPKPPGFVLVIGQVYNTNAVTYVPGKNAAWYLSQGGGATRLGDRGAIFIIRANGEVVANHGNGWWDGKVLQDAVRPGDTLVVPEKPVSGGARWKNLIALAQVAEAGAITAAIVP